MNCSNCGAANPGDQRFCDNCGTALSADCPNCGRPNRPGARFCGNCGTTLDAGQPTTVTPAVAVSGTTTAPSSAVAERRLVSVLFADLIGFTPFAEERDAEEVRETLSRYFDAARTVIERHGGTVEKFIGDAVMAVWGTPVAREDDAERAVRAALELLPAVRGVDEGLQARAAVLTGEAAVAVGAGDQGMLAGDLVNTAARLQSVAAPGTVLVGESTMRSSSAAVAFEPAGEQSLKGKSAPIPAWRALRVIAERGGRARSDALEPPFVGRDAELTLLKDLLHATGREGRARLVAVTGPGGIGKSRLAWELEKYVDGLVELIYWHRGRSPSYGEGVSFWALGEMVRRRAGLAETDDEPTTRQRIAQTVSQFVPDEEDRRWVEPALLALLGVEPAPPGGRDVLFAAWRIFFERIAAQGTTVLLFEDLQFADSGLLDFIDHLLEWSKAVPILVLILARPELLERRPEFGSATRHFHSVPLEPLPEEAMSDLLAGLVPGLPPAAVSAIVARADGIPLYAVETIRMLIADGRLEPTGDGAYRPVGQLGELTIPDTLRSLIASRLDSLEPADRALLQHGAVLGQTFTLDSLAAVSGAAAEELVPRLRQMVRRELLALEADPRSPERGQYRFVQGLIREVAYGTLARRDRRERHLGAARHFESVGDEETAGALASHYLAAYRASEPGPEADAVAAQARLALRGAAERASALGAYGQAIGHLEQALDVTHDMADRADLLERAIRAAQADARYEHGIDLARQAIDAYRAKGDRLGMARSSGLLGTLFVELSRQGDAVEVLTGALAELPAEADELRADLAARLSRAYMRSRQMEAAIAAADQALSIAEAGAMIEVIAEALVNKGAALANRGRWREGAAIGEVAARLADQAGAASLHLRALNNLASNVGDDDPARALRIASEALEVARRLGLRGMVNWLTGTVAGGKYWAGSDWDETIAMLATASEEAGNDADRLRLLVLRLPFESARGADDDAMSERIQALAESTDDPGMGGLIQLVRGERLLTRGEFRAAYEEFKGAAEIDLGDAQAPIFQLRSAIWAADPQLIREAYLALDGLPYSGRAVTGSKTWGRAAMAVVDGRRAEAIAGFREAIARATDIELGFEAARIALDAVILMPDEPEVRAMAEDARSTFDATRAQAYLDRLDAALAGAEETSAARETAAEAPPSVQGTVARRG